MPTTTKGSVMSDDRLSELLELADGPVAFPADRRAELRGSMLATAAQPRHLGDSDASLPLRPIARGSARAPRVWRPIAMAAAAVAVVVGALVGLSRLPDRTPAPVVSTPIDRPTTLAELCQQAREDAIANGLIGSGSPSSASEVRRLADALNDLTVRSDRGDQDLAGLAARVRLLAAAIDDADGGAVINTRRSIGRDVEALFDPDAVCGD